MSEALLQVRDLRKWYAASGGLFFRRKEHVKAVDGVTFDVHDGEVLSLVGESGSGKSTVGKAVMRLMDIDQGSVRFDGQELSNLSRRKMRPIRSRIQIVFQDPFSSLNPRKTVGAILSAPLEIHEPGLTAAQRRERIAQTLQLVGLQPQHAQRYPHEFSGGQRQRIGIARALMSNPKLLVADEPVSALDVSIQAQVVNLLLELKRRLGLTLLFISHDLAVVGYISDRVAVMYLGRLVEIAPTASLFSNPRHPYTEALLSAVPLPDPRKRRSIQMLKGDMPSPRNPPSGCAFRTRCPYALPACADERPTLRSVGPGHLKACIRDDLQLRAAAGHGLSEPASASTT
jgi:oligopeptide transport system ATP-binding protein